MAYWHIANWTKKIYPSLTWDERSMSHKLYLSFDDGPTPGVTNRVLDILDEYNAKATFFCLGRNVERHPNLFQSMKDQGHVIGNHTYSHLKGWSTTNEEYFSDIHMADNIINSPLFRPPYGQISRSQISELKKKYSIIMWNVMTHDYEQRISKEYSLKATLKYAGHGSILVFHDSVKASEKLFYMLPKVLEFFTAQAYYFETIKPKTFDGLSET